MFNRKLTVFGRITIFGLMILSLLATSVGNTAAQSAEAPSAAAASALGNYAVVFVSRRIPGNGSVYYPQGGSLPGVQPYSRFQVASPGKLLVREANGALRTLIDGANPTAASLNLIDVNAPDVSYDGTRILFAGLPQGTYSQSAVNSPGAWRIYMINVDGTGLKQVTFSDRNINLAQFGSVASNFTKYDDTDPVWLPDGRIVFSSTRFPSFGQYGAALTSNLFVVNADGTNLHRITAERNGGERPVVDPLTGRIVYSRWWRNFRLGTNNMATIPYTEGYIMKDGVCALKFQGAECQEAGGLSNLERNSWHLAVINPDGTGLAQFAGRSMSTFIGEEVNHAYGGSFAADGSFYANFFPMMNGTEASGFGGIRRYQRGANGYTPIIGITTRNENILQFVSTSPTSYGVYVGNYAAEPAVLPDGTLLISWAANTAQDYGLYTINADGSGRTLVYDNPGTTEVRAKPIVARTVPPIIPDKVTQVASALPPLAQGPYNVDGNFTFKDLNVYFNAPVDTDIISAIPVGSASTIRFYTDFQRNQQRGSFEFLDWPILIGEVPVNPDGSLSAASPANIPLFEQIRTSQQAGYTIPLTGRGISPDEMPGAAHVAGMNFGRTGDVATCVGCHAGHSMIPVPANPADAQWTNLAPGATVTYSSLHSSLPNGNGAVDRKVKMRIAYNNHYRYWQSREGQSPNSQWLQLTFPVPVTVKTVRLYNIPASESSIKVMNTTVQLFSDKAGTNLVASSASGALSENGTDVPFTEVRARVVRILFTSVNGTNAGLGEVEVIARAEADVPDSVISGNVGTGGVTLNISGVGQTTSAADGSYSTSVPFGWNGTVTPTHACYTFNPPSLSFTNLNANATAQNFTSTFNTLSGCANVGVGISTTSLGQYAIPSHSAVTNYYDGLVGGPMFVQSVSGTNILASEHRNYKTSFSETLGYPNNQLTTKYWFTKYTYNSNVKTWILVSNPSGQAANVKISIGDLNASVDSFSLAPGASVSKFYDGVSTGPVLVQSVNGVNILASEHYNYQTSFYETLGYPDNQLTTKYWFTRYAYNDNVKTWLLIANPSSQSANVSVYIGDMKTAVESFSLPPGVMVSRFYNGLAKGPVVVQSTNGVNILASEHRNYQTSFSETLGYPDNLLTTEYWFTRYAYNSNVKTWLLIANPSSQSANVSVYLGNGANPVATYTLAPGVSITPYYDGMAAGPVRVVSTNGVNILTSEHRNYQTSFSETVGYPNNRLTTMYWFTRYAYNANVKTWLLLANP